LARADVAPLSSTRPAQSHNTALGRLICDTDGESGHRAPARSDLTVQPPSVLSEFACLQCFVHTALLYYQTDEHKKNCRKDRTTGSCRANRRPRERNSCKLQSPPPLSMFTKVRNQMLAVLRRYLDDSCTTPSWVMLSQHYNPFSCTITWCCSQPPLRSRLYVTQHATQPTLMQAICSMAARQPYNVRHA
jgi:hypothetical protein